MTSPIRVGPIRVGLIGANIDSGWAGRTHLPVLRSLPQYELAAVGTRNMASAQKTADRFDVPHAFDNSRDLIRHPDVDLVVVAVRTPFHHDLVMAALAEGKHVLCEWPLGASLEQTARMAAAARTRSLRAAVGLQGRSSPWLRAVRDVVASGRLGRILSSSLVASGMLGGPVLDTSYDYQLDPASGASMFTISFAHLLDCALFCLGEMADVSALFSRQHQQVVLGGSGAHAGETRVRPWADHIAFNGLLESGALFSVNVRGGTSRGTNLLWEINGTDGDLRVTADTPFLHWGPLHLDLGTGEATTLDQRLAVDPARADVPFPTDSIPAYVNACLYADFARDIREGTRICADFTAAEARYAFLDLLRRSDAEARRIQAS